MALRSQAPDADWLADHRRVWARKPALRAVYGRWFRWLRGKCAAGGPVVELGCGPGFFKAACPDILATDVWPNPFADCRLDASALPFASASVGNLVMIDVFHHLPEPVLFLHEAERVLQPRGRLLMLEPWIGLGGRLLWTYLHHEDCDLTVRPDAPWGGADKDPMMGNAALPYLYFRSGGHLAHLGTALRVIERQPFAGLPWLLSGGFQSFSLLPGAAAALAERLDRALSAAPAWSATRCVITIERGP
jgi:SAM-dependent methyltransferase